MEAQDIINFIANAKKVTPVKVFLKEREEIDFSGTNARVFGAGDRIIFGDWSELQPVLMINNDKIADIVIENTARNSAIPLLDLKDIPARIEPGAIIRDNVSIGKNAVIMMGAILNIGAVVGEGAVVAAGAVVIEDVAPGKVVAGCPARVIKDKDENTTLKTALQQSLRKI